MKATTTTISDIFRAVQTPGASFSEARRQIHMLGVKFNGQQVTAMEQEVEVKEGSLFQVGRHTWQRDTNKWIKLIPLQPDSEYQMDLIDISDGPEQPSIQLRVRRGGSNEPLLMIGAEGYGEMTAEDGYGFPIVLEYHEGAFRLLVWSDINEEDPTHIISLEGAREDVRAPDHGDQ